jgi:hypothetical protein
LHHNANQGSIPLPKEIPFEKIPTYFTHANVYKHVIRQQIKNYADQMKVKNAKTWHATGKRDDIVLQIRSEERKMVALHNAELITKLKGKLERMDSLLAALKKKDNMNVRSKLMTVSPAASLPLFDPVTEC